jgi:hypothetical protein
VGCAGDLAAGWQLLYSQDSLSDRLKTLQLCHSEPRSGEESLALTGYDVGNARDSSLATLVQNDIAEF